MGLAHRVKFKVNRIKFEEIIKMPATAARRRYRRYSIGKVIANLDFESDHNFDCVGSSLITNWIFPNFYIREKVSSGGHLPEVKFPKFSL